MRSPLGLGIELSSQEISKTKNCGKFFLEVVFAKNCIENVRYVSLNRRDLTEPSMLEKHFVPAKNQNEAIRLRKKLLKKVS